MTDKTSLSDSKALPEGQIESILYAGPAVLYALKSEGGALTPFWVSKNITRIMGYEPAECLGDPGWWIAGVHPDDREAALARIPTLLATGALEHEYRFRHKNGRYFWVRDELAVSRGWPGQDMEIAGAWLDITERKRAEEALKDSEARYRALVELSPDAIYVHQNGRIIFANASTASLLAACGIDEIVGRRVLDFVPPEDHARVAGRIRDALTTRQTTPLADFRMNRLDGVIIDVAVTGRAIDWKGEAAVLVVVRDISERKARDREIRELNADLERRVEARTAELRAAQEDLLRAERLATLGHLTATVSHELRNPLGAVRNSAFVLGRVLDRKDAQVAQALERIERSVVRCDRIIEELLDFTRMAGAHRQPAVLDRWLHDLLSEQEIPPDITLRRRLRLGNLTAAIDSERLRRAVINVIDNACQAMVEENGGREKVLSVGTAERNGRIEIVIEDTGPGIPPAARKRIFEPLFSTKNFGVGLGMPIVRQVMGQHGGGIDLETDVGRGTRVCLWFDPRA
jgi:PAS domain S-box-containing protein